MTTVQEKMRCNHGGYVTTGTDSILKPAFLVLKMYLSKPTKCNEETLNMYIEKIENYISFLKNEIKTKGLDCKKMNDLITMMEKNKKDILEQKSKISASLCVERNTLEKHRDIIDEITYYLNMEKDDHFDVEADKPTLVRYSLAMCGIELFLVQNKLSALQEENDESKICSLENINNDLENLQELCKDFLKKIDSTK